MKFIKHVAVILIALLLLSIFAACGSIFDDSETSLVDSSTSSDNGKNIDKSSQVAVAQEAAKEENKQAQAELQKPVTVTAEDKAANIDKYIGNWVDTSDETRFCVIKKTEIGYSYTDNESNFPAEVKDGVLNIHIEVDDTIAIGKVDETTGILTITYQDQDTTYKKKQE
jgi:hypothetical protein